MVYKIPFTFAIFTVNMTFEQRHLYGRVILKTGEKICCFKQSELNLKNLKSKLLVTAFHFPFSLSKTVH